jgi:hypothetical protein
MAKDPWFFSVYFVLCVETYSLHSLPPSGGFVLQGNLILHMNRLPLHLNNNAYIVPVHFVIRVNQHNTKFLLDFNVVS